MDIETPFGEGSYLLPLFVLVIMIRVNIETINLIIVVTIFIISNLTFPVAPRRGAWIEIVKSSAIIQGISVAPRRGAWIEITKAYGLKIPLILKVLRFGNMETWK